MVEAGTGYLIDILALLLATVVIVPTFHALRLGAILGYLAAGAILGPWGLALINEVEGNSPFRRIWRHFPVICARN